MASSDLAIELEEYCPNCGAWVTYLYFNHDTGWCVECSPKESNACTHCGNVRTDLSRTTCGSCRRELWLQRHADEIELLVIVKGYSVYQAQQTVVKIVRPICIACGRVIKGGQEGVLFHGRNQSKQCYAAYRKFKQLQNQGLTTDEALAKLRGL